MACASSKVDQGRGLNDSSRSRELEDTARSRSCRAGGGARSASGVAEQGVGGRRHRGRTLDVGSTVHWLPEASAGPHGEGRASPGVQRSARHARPGHPDAVRPVRRRRRVPGQEGQRPPGDVRPVPGDDLRRRQHRREPARERTLPRRAHRRRLKPDARRRRFGGKPRVRRRLRRTPPRSERRLPSHGRLPSGPVRAGERRDDERLPRCRLPVPVRERRRDRDRQAVVPGLRRQAVQLRRTASASTRSDSSARPWRRRRRS